ncbi:hypothetical protein [Pseudescherichia sp.]|uniref:hypothetical protein n=1 Tax=Pseudescherichia sp. TaxID=2055881 RepID=UPI00289D397B|nr:hypothetical protein [Pseudescherichia sp.]
MSIQCLDLLNDSEAYSLTAVHAALKAPSDKHPVLFEQDADFHYFHDCGRLVSSFKAGKGLTHWGDMVCFDAYSRWLGYVDTAQMLAAVTDTNH